MKVAIYTRVSGKSSRQDAANQSVTVDRILPSVKAGKDTRNKRLLEVLAATPDPEDEPESLGLPN